MESRNLKEEDILKVLKDRPLHFEKIVSSLGLSKSERKQLKKILKKLKQEGKITVEKGKYKLMQETVVVGKVLAHPSGFGFLEVGQGQKDIYIPPFEMLRLFHGDVVRAKVVEYKGKKEIRVLKVLERSKKSLVCKIKKEDGVCYAQPLDENAFHRVLLPKDSCKSLEEDTVVVVDIKKYPTPTSPPQGKIREVLGHPQKGGGTFIIEVLIRKYDLPTQYPPEVLKEVEELELGVEKELGKRRDLRQQVCFTIDPERARDFDDAVAIERTPEGYYRLWVHIADVSYYVREGSAIDREAFRRGFTFYLPDRAIHMLPEKLSADLCSLKPNEDRLAFTCEMLFSPKGDLISYDIYESVIRSKARLTYDEALRLIVGDPALENKYPHLTEPLRTMEDLYRILSRRRWERGSIDFDLPETELLLSEQGEPIAINPYERHVAHRIIEHFMISANETVALHLQNAGYPCLYRVHERPDPKKVENLLEILAGLGYTVKKPSLEPKFFQKIIEDFEGRPEEHLVRFLTLRAMMRAHYSPHNVGHFGLASQHYTHFTSPIRRYADLVVHRLLKKALRGEPVDYERTVEYLEMVGEHLSRQEELADDVEREAVDKLKVRLMRAHLGEEFDGLITGVVSFGLFVELRDYLVEGLVSISTMDDDQYLYDEQAHRLVGVRTGKIFRLGDLVRVKIVGVDEERGKLNLVLVQKKS
ncbi:ribonuclease R [Thermocrinis albus DSM 14484]|uniref:Ribonuclease R n=1 Tax=Thermocrinis albus (strain DSM 14484 / JCM 11386 / HI 11/12) TaxID=638303 RepID=D3SL54_THEAH|nr:ribonuclease R [Thermocrinis albus]ADC89484.1 ribonuclease R [Thermocrinis albus DSM 14484]